MCGRYALYGPKSVSKAERDYLDGLDLFPPHYNIAPSDTAPILRAVEAAPQLVPARWGLIPFWAKDEKIGFKTINARAETVAEKPAFRSAYKFRRCLIPANGYFEWQQRPSHKQPYYFTSRDGSLLMFAGLWETWRPKEREPLTSFTIVVCKPNPLAAGIHDRMPVIIDPKDWQRWLTDADPADLLRPCPDEALQAYPVSTLVNRPQNDHPSLVEPIEGEPRLTIEYDPEDG